MYVLVRDVSATVCEADDCGSLDVRIAASDGMTTSAALSSAGLGSWDGRAEIQLNVAPLHTLAAAAATMPDWTTRWDAMLAYAARSGWLSADGTTVRAHVVSIDSETD